MSDSTDLCSVPHSHHTLYGAMKEELFSLEGSSTSGEDRSIKRMGHMRNMSHGYDWVKRTSAIKG